MKIILYINTNHSLRTVLMCGFIAIMCFNASMKDCLFQGDFPFIQIIIRVMVKLTKEVASMAIEGKDDPCIPHNKVFAVNGFLFNLLLMHSELLVDHELSAKIYK